jgi:SPP1 family predicted phage head-tail adaptor
MPTYRLTKRVVINRHEKRTSDFEFAGDGVVEVCAAWAEIQPLLAFERVNAEQIAKGATHRVVIRWPGVELDSGMMVCTDEVRYEIQSVVDILGEGKYLELLCTKKTNAVGASTTR